MTILPRGRLLPGLDAVSEYQTKVGTIAGAADTIALTAYIAGLQA